MEFPHLSRPLAAEGRKATHDFLSLYSNSPVQQDPRPPSHGEYLKTHNFLQPLEKEDEIKLIQDKVDGVNIEKRPPSAPPSIEKVLPGGTAYGINHATYSNPWMAKSGGTAFNLEVSDDVRHDENSNCSSYTAGSSFTLWEGSSAGKRKSGKAGSTDLNFTKDATLRTVQWPVERPSESSANHPNSFTSRSSSQPPAQINQSFVQMLKSTKLPAKEEIEDEVFAQREEGSSHRGELRTGFDGGASNDQKPSTPRSKHSATEQRRRCKINDRFHMLREIIPRSDQKRDKASFLLEVIEYIQFLQEKVSRYEGYPGSSSETANLTPWKSSPKLSESSADQAHVVNAPLSAFNPVDKSNIFASTIQRIQQTSAEPRISTPIPLKAIDQQPGMMYKAASFPISQPKSNMFPSTRTTDSAPPQPTCRLATPNTDNVPLQQLQLLQHRDLSSTTANQKPAVEGSAVSVSSMYSQGLMSTLTQALKSFGVDVSQTNISVQVDVGKRTKSAQTAKNTHKDFDINLDSHSLVHEREEGDFPKESDYATKKRKTLES